MNWDISALLEQWPYQAGQVVVRRFKGKDGTQKIQLRVDLGILQMNAEGRPDGKKPFGHESLHDHFLAQLTKHREKGGSDDDFTLKPEDCAKLQQEAIQYHHRYICLYQLDDFEGVIRDTERNLEVFQFVNEFAESDELSWSLLQFTPQLLMMRIRAEGTLAVKANEFDEATARIRNGLDELREFYRSHERGDLQENSAEIQSLENWLAELGNRRPLSEREKLELALNEAVAREDYEKAAQVRDALRNLKPAKSK